MYGAAARRTDGGSTRYTTDASEGSIDVTFGGSRASLQTSSSFSSATFLMACLMEALSCVSYCEILL